MDELAVVMNGWIEAAPLLGRLFFVSVELCVLAPVLAVLVKLKLIPIHRLQSLLWLFVLLNVLFGVAAKAPYAIGIWESPPPSVAVVVPSAGKVFRPELTRVYGNAAVTTTSKVARPQRTSTAAPNPEADTSALAGISAPVGWRRWSVVDGVAALWILGVVGMLSFLALEGFRLRKLLRRCTGAGVPLADVYDAEVRRLGVEKRPELRVTDALETPAIVGVWHPVILIPRWLEEGGTPNQWSWTLRHELTHWVHGDTLGQMIRLLAQSVFFFHPVVWWAGKRWEEATELACDRSLLQSDGDAVGYASGLCDLLGMIGKRQRPLMTTGLFASRSHIGRRIEILLADPMARPGRLGLGHRVVAAVVLVMLLGVGVGRAETSPPAKGPVAQQVRSASPSTPQPELPTGRVLQFPEDYSMGSLRIGDQRVEARGTVRIPDGENVFFQLNEAGAADLSPLDYIEPGAIQGLSLWGTGVQNEELVHLQGLRGLTNLELGETAISDEGIQYLTGLTELRRLNLNSIPVTDAAMGYLRDMTQLEQLILNRTMVGDRGLAEIQHLTNMEYLDLWMLDVTDEGMQYLANMTNMNELGIEDTLITDAGLRYLEGMTQLRDLNLENNNITDAGMASLAKLTGLVSLNIMDTYITEGTMSLLTSLVNLANLGLPVQIGPDGLQYFEGTALYAQLSATLESLRPITISITGGGRPLPDAYFSVELALDRGKQDIHFFKTDEAGNATIYGPAQEGHTRLRAFADGYVTNQAEWMPPVPGHLQLDLERATTMGGIVVDLDGQPVAGVSVSVPILGGHNWDTKDDLPHSVTTDANGQWRCDVVPKNLTEFWVSLDHRDYATTTYPMADLPIAALRDGTAVLTIADAIGMPGVVVDEAGKGIENVRVAEVEPWRKHGERMSGRVAVSDSEGSFEVNPIRPGKTRLKIDAVGYSTQKMDVDVAVDMAPVRIVLSTVGTLRGRVVNAEGEALAGITAAVIVIGTDGISQSQWRGKTDKEGRFAWLDVPKGTIAVDFRLNEENHTVSAVQLSEEEQDFEVPFGEKPRTEGLEAGKALIAAYNARHTVEAMGDVVFRFQVEEQFHKGARAKVRRYEGVRMGDGRYRESVRFGEDGAEKLPWLQTWNGSTYLAHRHPIPGKEGELDPTQFFVGASEKEADHLVALDWLLIFVREHSYTVRHEVMAYENATVTLGTDQQVAMQMHFSDLERLEYDRIEYFDKKGELVFVIEASGWSGYNDKSYPETVTGQYNYPSMKGKSTFTFEMMLPVELTGEDFTLEIPPGSVIVYGGPEAIATVPLAELNSTLVGEKKYREALIGYVLKQ